MIKAARKSTYQELIALLVVLAVLMMWVSPAQAQESEPLRIVNTDDDPADRPGTVFFNWYEPREGRRFPAYLSDADSDLRDKAWEWSRADAEDGPFTVIDGATDSTYTPQSSDVGQYLKATVTYSDGHGTGKSAEAVSQRPVRGKGCLIA